MSLPHLPKEVQAKVLEFLPVSSVLSYSATSKSMLQSASLVETIHIDEPSQLNARVARRFQGVLTISMHSLFSEDYIEGSENVYQVTARRIVPFLSDFPRSLTAVTFGYSLSGVINRKPLIFLVESFAGAFEYGALRNDLDVMGLYCPTWYPSRIERSRTCTLCTTLCETFPIPQAADARSCLPVCEIERIVSSRQGGQEFLLSKERFLQLLGSGQCERTLTRDVVEYEQESLEEMKTLASSHKLVAHLSSQEVSDAINASFLSDGEHGPHDVCYIGERSFACLRHELGLPVGDGTFLLTEQRANELAEPPRSPAAVNINALIDPMVRQLSLPGDESDETSFDSAMMADFAEVYQRAVDS